MKGKFLFLMGCAALLAPASRVEAQVTANPVTSAADAFGFRIGEETVGIYDESSVRGFDLEAAGNYRVNGTYFVKSSGVSNFFVETSTVRIGLNTLAVDLPGPSGVVDYRLRDPAAGERSFATAGLDEYEQPYLDFLWRDRSADGDIAATLGLGLVFEKDNGQGGRVGHSWLLGGTVRAQVAGGAAQLFGGEYRYEQSARFRFSAADPDALPRVERRRNFGQDWAVDRGQRRIAGLLFDRPLTDSFSAGVTGVFSQTAPTRAHTQLFLGLDTDRRGRSLVIASPEQSFTAWSGEGRLRWTSASHIVSLLARGRLSRNRFGGDRILDLGFVDLDAPIADAPAPDLSGAVASLRDRIDQWGVGLSYRGEFGARATVNAGLLSTHYRKTFVPAAGGAQESSASPLLYNLGGALALAPRLTTYGSYSRGLEEAGTAPSSAANRNEVLSAILVTQRELGLRYALTPSLTVIVAAFETRKPYAGVEAATNIFRILGTVRHRGIEGSLSGRIADGLSVVVGGVYLWPRLEGSEVERGTIGPRPIGVASFRGIANLNYAVAGIEGLSLDAGLRYVGARPYLSSLDAEGMQPRLPATLLVNLGLRYRLPFDEGRTTLRAQLLNAFDSYGYSANSAGTLEYGAPRRFRLAVTRDF